MRFVHHHDDFTATANRLVSGDLLHLEALNRSRSVVLSDVVRGEFLEKLLGTYLCQLCRQKKKTSFGISPRSRGLAQGMPCFTETRRSHP